MYFLKVHRKLFFFHFFHLPYRAHLWREKLYFLSFYLSTPIFHCQGRSFFIQLYIKISNSTGLVQCLRNLCFYLMYTHNKGLALENTQCSNHISLIKEVRNLGCSFTSKHTGTRLVFKFIPSLMLS